MRTAGVFLIFAAVTLRGFVIFSAEPQFMLIMGLLAGYGLLLSGKTWFTDREAKVKESPSGKRWMSAYLLLQATLVLVLLIVSWSEDFFALLFIPLSLDVISHFGRRYGYVWIAAFSLALTGALLLAEEGQIFGVAMGVFYSGLCFLFGGYAHQVRKAELAHTQNQRMFKELESAHYQLQGYATRAANLAMEKERNRLARELHDSVTQTVFSMNLAAQSARLLLDKDVHRVSEQLLRIDDLAASALNEIQSLITQLQPHSVVKEDLPTALHRLAEERRERDGLQIMLEICGERSLPSPVTAGLYSIVHEALVNVAKHSGSDEAFVRLDLSGDGSCLEIEDHGTGFDPKLAWNQPGHLGLAGMSERACEIGWSLTVDSERGRGTRILLIEEHPRGSV